jgi:hypothetical protein
VADVPAFLDIQACASGHSKGPREGAMNQKVSSSSTGCRERPSQNVSSSSAASGTSKPSSVVYKIFMISLRVSSFGSPSFPSLSDAS